MPTRPRYARALVLAWAAAFAALVGSPGIAAANDGRPQANPEERAAAMIRPAVMFLTGQGYGLVRLPSGQVLSQFGPGSSMPFIATWACTAFVVNPDGWVATAGHCVDPASAKALILKRAAAEYIAQFPGLPESRDPAATFDWLDKNARVEGDSPERGPELSLTLLYGTGANVAGKVAASVVDFRPIGKGDVALLKVDKHNLPSSQLATDAEVSIGTSVLAVGFPERTQNITGPSLDPTNKSGKVSKKSTMGSAPVYEIDAAVTEGMSGGPTVELNGNVIGVNSLAPIGESQAFNFIAGADSLTAIMTSKGVKARLGPADVYYRKGLEHYYSGHYTEAIDDFDLTLSMTPDYPGLVDLKASAANLRQQYGDVAVFSGAKLLWYIVGGVALVLAAGAGLTFIVVRSRSPLLSLGVVPGPVSLRAAPQESAGVTPPEGATATEAHFCSSCGAQHHRDETFCPNCGKQIVFGGTTLGAKHAR